MFLEIANHLWQSTVFAGFVALLCRLLKNDGAHVRYWLWWAASVKFLLPFALLTAVGGWLASLASVAVMPAAWTDTVTVVARPFPPDTGAWSPGVVLLAIWTAGSAAVLGGWLVRAVRLQRVLQRAERGRSPLPENASGHVSVYRTESGVEPGVVGILRTALLLPAGIEERLSSAQLEAVLAHELCHIHRRDNLTAAVHMIVEGLFWFHPLVWWIGAKLIDERERACDEMVVRLGHDRETYAGSIIDVCVHYAVSPLRCAAGISGSDLKRRITQIMRYQGMNSLNVSKKLLLGTVAFACLVIPIVGGLALQRTAMAQEDTAGAGPRAPDNRFEGEYLPIFKPAPVYPPNAVARGLEGHVVVEYTVTADGSTENVRAVESSSSIFGEAAIQSASKYKYRPRTVNGQPQAVDGVRTRIEFVLGGGEIESNADDTPDDADSEAP